MPEPKSEPAAIDRPIEAGTIPIGPAVSWNRIAMALGSVLVLVVVVARVGAILDSRQGTSPGAVDRPAPEPPEPILAPLPPESPAPVVVAKVEPSPVSGVQPPSAPVENAGTRVVEALRVDPPAPAIEPAPDPTARPLTIRRRQMLSQEALRRQLSELPEIRLSHATEAMLLGSHGLHPIAHNPHRAQPARGLVGQPGFLAPAFRGQAARPFERPAEPDMHVAHQRDNSAATIALLRRKQPELGALPWRMGEECHLPHESAEELEVQSRRLRDLLSAAIPIGDTRPDAETLRSTLLAPEAISVTVGRRIGAIRAPGLVQPTPQLRSDVPAAIPALMQLLMAERTPARLILAEVLGRIQGPEASRALARLALFDLAPEVRERALLALRDRPAAEYRKDLLGGLRYPWAPVADHAAEALATLGDREAIPDLVGLLDGPDPQHPRTEIRSGQPVTFVRSLVQVNHLRNCLLCHAPSTSPTTDLVRGRVPTEGMPLPPPRQYYAGDSSSTFVRAEVTYLRQDFSVTQPVEQSGPWPGFQRYDYLVSEQPIADHRPPRPKGKAREKGANPQRESVLFALRELTGRDLGAAYAAWKAATLPKPPGE